MIRSILLTFLLLPLVATASDGTLGEGSRWFVQVNLAAMRDASDDGALYDWLQREVIDDLEEEFGQGSVDDFDAVTAFGASNNSEGLGIVLDGRMDASMRERLIERLAAEPLTDIADGEAYEVGSNEKLVDEFNLEFDDGSLFLAFGEDAAAFVTSSRALLDDFLAGERFQRLAASELLVIRANPLLSGAVDTESIGAGHGNWNSQVMRNIRRAGFALTDADGSYDVNIELIAVDEAQAQALQNIVQGVIGLQTLSREEPDLAFVSTLQTQREGERVSLSVQVSSQELMGLID